MDNKPRGLITAGAMFAALLGTWLWLSMLAGPWNLASGLLDARAHLERSEKAIQRGSVKAARYETLAAGAAARRARAGLGSAGPVMDLLRRLPKVGDALGETEHFVRAAELSAEAAKGTLDIAENALRGPNKIIARDPEDPDSARIRLDRIAEIADTVRTVRGLIAKAGDELRAVELSRLPKRLRDDVTKGIAQAEDTDELLADAEAGFKILPSFLGANGRRTYLIGMQNTAEERGTGGSILQFTRLTIENGAPKLPKEKKRSQSVYNVDEDRTQFHDVPVPEDAWYVREVNDAKRFGNANWSPHWPLSATLMVDYAQAADPTFPEVDGVIAVDPYTLQNLMAGVGPFNTHYGNRISTRKSVPFLLNRAYGAFGPLDSVRKAVLRSVVDRFYQGMIKPAHPTELVQGMGKSLSDKHMLIWLRDPVEQAFIERMDWDGGIDEGKDGDYLNVVEQNAGGNKLDYFQQQKHTLDVSFEGDDAVSSFLLEVTNGTLLPQHRRVMGDSGGDAHGMTRPMMNVYVPGTAALVRAAPDGTLTSLGDSGVGGWTSGLPPTHLEVGKKVWSAVFEIPVEDTQSVRYDYRVPDVLRTVDGRRVYRLVVQHQPKVNPETFILRIKLPEGATDVVAKGFERKGETLVLERSIERDMELEVSWQE
jgi:Protein of unknown function (DUF4012)